ncbi:MAG: TRAP transporter large permease subunit [Gammaproteobacteria bacterium]
MAAVASVLTLLIVTLGAGVWVGFSLFAVGIISLELFRSMPVEKLLAQNLWGNLTSPELIALPLFIFMGELLYRTRLASDLFKGLSLWTNRLPGRLLHVNVLGCTIFAAISGSSAATTVTVGRITLRELLSRGYDRGLVIGSLAGAGTFGFLIPPSIFLIVYGVLAEASILKLFLAGIVPGLVLALAYMVYIGVRASLNSDLVPNDETAVTWGERIKGLAYLGPPLCLIFAVLGSMYGGLASPTEAAAVGVFGALVLGIAQRSLSLDGFYKASLGAVRTTSMIGLIVAGAFFLSVAMAFLGVPQLIATAIAGLELGPISLILVLIVFYAALGCIMEGLSMIVMTLPITLPLILQAGFDKIWFGIFLVVVVEMAQITPPIGFNLFVLQSLTKDEVTRTARYALPFFLILLGFALFIGLVPDLVTFLPSSVQFRN